MGKLLAPVFGKEKAKRIEFMLNTLVFGVTAIDYLDQGYTTIAIILIVIGLINLITFLVIKVHQFLGKAIVSIITMLASVAISYGYFISGSQYVKYIWLGIAVLNLTVAVIFWIKWKKYSAGES